MKRLGILSICVIMLTLTACKSTPENNVSEMPPNKMVSDGEGTVFSDFPSRYAKQEELHDGINLSVNADVVLPETALCTAKIERYSFDMPLIKKVAGVLFGDAPIYQYADTKQELLEYSATMKRQIDIAGDVLSEGGVLIQQVLENIETALPTACDSEEIATIESIFSYDNGFTEVETGREKKATFQALSDTYRQIISYYNLGFRKHLLEDIAPLSLSEEEALEQAWDILRQLGLSEEFLVVKTGIHTINHTLADQILEDHSYAFPSRHERRYVIFMRKINGAKQVYSEQIQRGAVMGAYGTAAFWELLEMQFDDKGLVGFNWNEPGNVVVDTNNVSVISLDSAYQSFIDYLGSSQNKYTYEQFNIDSKKITIAIDRIELGMSCVVGKNGSIEAIPVWEFFGEIRYLGDSGESLFVDFDGQQLTQKTRDCNSICTIDALSGKRIDRGLGY